MKLILKYISIVTVLLLAFSCDFDENGPMPNDMVETSFAYIDFDADASSPFINIADPGGYVASGSVDVLFKKRVPFDKVTLMVAMNGAYDKAGIIEDDIVTVPFDFTVTVQDIVDALDELGSASEITEDDVFKIYATPTVGGVEYPPYQVLGGKSYSTASSSIMQNLTAFTGLSNADVNISCMLVCLLENGVSDLAGSWSGVDAWAWNSQVTTEVAGPSSLTVSGMSVGFMEEWWGETITDGGSFTMNVTDFGTVEIPRQYIYTTDYEGDAYRYEIAGEGFWNNCGDAPTLSIKYDIYYEGDVSGLGASYAQAYLGGSGPYLNAEITLDAGAAAQMVTKSASKVIKPPFKN